MPPEVPATVKASVPLLVTGELAIETMPPVKDAPTDVTVPAPAVDQTNADPFHCKYVPPTVGAATKDVVLVLVW